MKDLRSSTSNGQEGSERAVLHRPYRNRDCEESFVYLPALPPATRAGSFPVLPLSSYRSCVLVFAQAILMSVSRCLIGTQASEYRQRCCLYRTGWQTRECRRQKTPCDSLCF